MTVDLELLAPYIAGTLGVPIVNFLKNQFDIKGRWAVLLAFGVSGVLALFGVWLFGEFDFTVEGTLATIGQSFTMATLIYKFIAGVNITLNP